MSTVMVTFRGKEHDLHKLCRRFHIDVRTAQCRLARGWSPEETFTTPPRSYPKLVERHRAPQPPEQEPVVRTLPSQLLEDAEMLIRECMGVLRDSVLSSRRQAMAVVSCEEWLRRRAPTPATLSAASH